MLTVGVAAALHGMECTHGHDDEGSEQFVRKIVHTRVQCLQGYKLP